MRQLLLIAFVATLGLATSSLRADDEAPIPPATSLNPQLAPTPSASTRDGIATPSASSARTLPRPGALPRVQIASLGDAQMTNQTRQALAFYGGYSARATLSQLPRRTRIQSAPPQPMQRQLKPFNAYQPDTETLSPYLNLDRDETAEDVPNYFTFVRPQIEQRETNRSQYRELQRLQRQVNSVSATIASPQQTTASPPGTGTPARFMDTAQFYGGWPR